MFGLNEIWFLLVIPLLVTLWAIAFHRNATKFWEVLLIWSVSIIVIFISQVVVEKISISDTEHWGFNGVKAIYNEPFKYWDTCTEQYACGET